MQDKRKSVPQHKLNGQLQVRETASWPRQRKTENNYSEVKQGRQVDESLHFTIMLWAKSKSFEHCMEIKKKNNLQLRR